MNQRIIGIDVARAIAIIGMIIVNFKMVFGHKGTHWLESMVSILDGKAAATFVVLAGVGIAFMTNRAIDKNDDARLRQSQIKIVKRALLLFAIGLSYLFIWPADILHFYGIYMLLTLLLIKSKPNVILVFALSTILVYPLLMAFFSYDYNWDFSTFEYQGFWTLSGFVSNLFYNGFHPVLPWTAFMLIGLWFGKQDLNDDGFIKKTIWISLALFILLKVISIIFISLLSDGNTNTTTDLSLVFGTSPMPPLPIYMLTGSSIAIFVISLSILVSKKLKGNVIVRSLSKTGQLALSFYVAHVVVGMGIVEITDYKDLGEFSLAFSIIYALAFSLLCILFAVIWLRYKKTGPLEWVMRKLSN